MKKYRLEVRLKTGVFVEVEGNRDFEKTVKRLHELQQEYSEKEEKKRDIGFKP